MYVAFAVQNDLFVQRTVAFIVVDVAMVIEEQSNLLIISHH